MVGAEALLAVAAVDERIGEAADVARDLPDARVEDDRGVEREDVVALLHHRRQPAGLDVVLQQDAVVAVVVGGAEAAVDLRGGEDEAAPARRARRSCPSSRCRGSQSRRRSDSLRRDDPARETVELHILSDSTGETAARLVAALEAQFPEQPFEEVRHPQIQTIDDLQLAVSRAKGRPAVMVYTLVDRELRESMRTLCRSARLHYCRPARPSDRVDREGLGDGRADDAGRAAAAQLGLLQADGGDRVRGQVRRRRRQRPRTRPTSCSSASPAPRRRRSRSTSATWATRRRTCRS